MSITLWKNLANRAEKMARDAFKGISSREEWERTRPARKQEFLRALGLDPLPERCKPKVREYGAFQGKGYRARNIGFQILPDCWASAAIYYPDPKESNGTAPGVLYVCGHAGTGSHHYHPHPIMWARRGYVCLVLDTIEQNDNPGEHHGFAVNKHDSWLSLGYSSAGGETLNSIRALDLLAADPLVDPERLGVTGISGGGAVSFYLGIIDERIKAVATLCGISSPVDAIGNHHLFGHCDCLYPNNVYGRDISEYAALIAPRAALFCFGDNDSLYDPEQTRALVNRTRKIFEFYGEADRCQLSAIPCGHENHPTFIEATQRLFDRYVAGDERPCLALGDRELPTVTTTIFNGVAPHPNHLDLLPELISIRGSVPLPRSPEEWPEIRRKALETLPALTVEEESTGMRLRRQWNQKNRIVSRHHGSIGGVDVWLDLILRPNSKKLLLGIASGGEFSQHILASLGGLPASISFAGFEPRLSACNYPAQAPVPFPAGGQSKDVTNRMTRAMVLTGQTPVMMNIHDTRAAVGYLLGLEELRNFEIYLYGRGEAAVAALYTALVDERVAGAILENLPASHTDRTPILGILRAFDIPQAVGLMAPRKVGIVTGGHNQWTWPKRAYERLGCPENLVMTDDRWDAFHRLLS